MTTALVSSAIVIFEKCKPEPGHEVALSFGGTLTEPAKIERVKLDELRASKKWSSLARQGGNGRKAGLVTLGDLFTMKRGLATGNNGFFIVPRAKVRELGIPPSCIRPILPSPRFLKLEVIEADGDGWPVLEQQLGLIDCGLSEEEIGRKWPRFAQYLEAGKKQGVHQGYLASRRVPWYSQEKREPAPFVCTYMGRSLERPFRFIWNRSRATAANVYLLLYPKAHVVHNLTEKAEAALEALRAIHAEHFISEGRVYGGGLHKMEPAELMRLPAHDLAKVLGAKVEQQRSLF